MRMAKEVAQNSKCLSRKIGSVLVRKKNIISVGYNGPSSNLPHCASRNPNLEEVCPRQLQGYKSGEGLHLCPAVHSEVNCILAAAKYGIPTEGTTLVCYCGIPCSNCLKEIINAGINEVVYKKNSSTNNKGDDYYDGLSRWIAENSNLIIRGVEIDEES